MPTTYRRKVIGDRSIDIPVQQDIDAGWEEVPNNGWEEVPTPPKEQPGITRRIWDAINTPATSLLPDKAKSAVRDVLGYNPTFRTALSLGLIDPARVRGVENVQADLAEGFTSPLGLGTLAVPWGRVPQIVRAGAGLGFAGQSLSNLPTRYQQLTSGEKQAETEGLLGGAADIAMGIGGYKLARSRPHGSTTEVNKNQSDTVVTRPTGELTDEMRRASFDFYGEQANEPLPQPWTATGEKGNYLVSDNVVDSVIGDKYPQLKTASQSVKRQFLLDKQTSEVVDTPQYNKFDQGIEQLQEAEKISSNPPVKNQTVTGDPVWTEPISRPGRETTVKYEVPPKSPTILPGPVEFQGPVTDIYSKPAKTALDVALERSQKSGRQQALDLLLRDPRFQSMPEALRTAIIRDQQLKIQEELNARENQQGMAGKVGEREKSLQQQSNQNPSSETPTTSGILQTPQQPKKGLMIPLAEASKYTDVSKFKRSSQALGITNPKAMEVAQAIKNMYEQIRAEFGEFVPSLVKELKNIKPFGITPDKERKVNPMSLKAKMLVRLSKAEQEVLKNLGVDKLLEDASKANRKVSVDEVLEQIKEFPQIEVKKLEADPNNQNIREQTRSNLQHQLETDLPASNLEDLRSFVSEMRNRNRPSDEAVSRYIRANQNNLSPEAQNRIRSFIDADWLAHNELNEANESATARYTMVNPKPLDKMPGAVDLLVRMPVKTPFKTYENWLKAANIEDSPRARQQYERVKEQGTGGTKFTSQHYPNEGKNLISHVRGYMETLPDGKKVFHVFEVQSDWAQQLREMKERSPDRVEGSTDDRAIQRMDDPSLQYYEHLALKAAIKHAIENGADGIAISDANTAMLSEMHDQVASAVKKISPTDAYYQILRVEPISDRVGSSYRNSNEAQMVKMFGEDWRNGKFVEFNQEIFRVDKPENNTWGNNRVETAKELQPYAEGGNYIPQEKGMRLHYDQSLPNILRKLTGVEPQKVSFGEHQNAVEEFKGEGLTPSEMRDYPKTYPRENLILKDPTTGQPQTDIKANLYSLDKLKERVGDLKEPFSAYSTLYSGIPLEAFGTAIKNTFKDLTSPEAKAKARELKTAAATIIRGAISDVARQGGEAGKYLAPKLSRYFGDVTRYHGQIVNDALNKMVEAKLSAKEQNDLMRYAWEARYGKPHTVSLNDRQQNLLAGLRETLIGVHNTQRELGILVNGIRQAQDSPNYWPGVTSSKVLDTILAKPGSIEALKLKNDWVQHVVEQAGGRVSIEEAKSTLKNYIDAISSFNKSSEEFNAIRKAEGYGVPWSWQEKSLPRLFERYGRRAARDFSYFQNLQNDPVARGILNIVDQFGKRDKNATELPGNIPMEPIASMPAVQDIFRWVNQDFTKADINFEAAGRLVRSAMLGIGTSVSNYFGNLNKVAPYLNPDQWGLYIKAHQNFREGLKAAYEQGVARVNPAEIANPTLGYNAVADRFNQLANGFYRWQGGSGSENFTRGMDMSLGQMIIPAHMGEAFKTGHKNSISVLDKLVKHAGVEDWRKFKDQMPNLPKEWLDRMSAAFVERVQQTYDPRDLPMWALNSKLAPFVSLSRWAIGASNHIYEDVVMPMKEGNYTPALNYLVMSGVVGGAAIPVLQKILTNRDSKDPSIKEAVLSGNKKEIAISFANALSLASFGGIVGDMTKAAIEVSQGRTPRGFTFPLVNFVANTLVERTRQAAEAIKNGEPADKVMLNYVLRAVQDNVQTLRIIANHTENAKDIAHQNKVRDYQVYRRLSNQPQTKTPPLNPFLGEATKEFKRSTDINEIPGLADKAISHVMEKTQDDPFKMASSLRGLKSAPITWMPSIENNPLEFMRYLDFVRKTQGEKAARDLMNQYAEQKALNQMKSKMVPSVRIR